MIDTFNPADNRHNVNAESRAEAAEARSAELAAQLATAQAALEQVTIERDEAQEHLVYLFDHLKVWLGARLIGEVEP